MKVFVVYFIFSLFVFTVVNCVESDNKEKGTKRKQLLPEGESLYCGGKEYVVADNIFSGSISFVRGAYLKGGGEHNVLGESSSKKIKTSDAAGPSSSKTAASRSSKDEKNPVEKIDTVPTPYAIKVDMKEKIGLEADFLTTLNGNAGFPHIFGHGDLPDTNKSYIIMPRLGQTIDYLFENSSKTFDIDTIRRIASQMIDRYQIIHSKGLLHLDGKPLNVCVGGTPETKNIIYIIDFGYCIKLNAPDESGRRFSDTVATNHGTLLFKPLDVLEEKKCSTRTDLEILAYNLLYFVKHGKLPWSGLSASSNLHVTRRAEFWSNIQGGLGREGEKLKKFMNVVKEITPGDNIDYGYLKVCLYDDNFTWDPLLKYTPYVPT